ncbi:MAG: bacteriohemerythrin [Defluviitaleaceae bacterium]|nr:bacteriohemerythrin [Defluviitaleaceae bacterium]
MWKDSFRIGVDKIDEQHKMLFDKTKELTDIFRDSKVENKQTIVDTILFLKQYAVQHFADEEAYQKSINNPGFEEHQAEHQQFVQTVLQLEKSLIASDFAANDVQNLIATLSTWLLYHVVGSDQQIGKVKVTESAKTHADKVRMSVAAVFNKVAGLDKEHLKDVEPKFKTTASDDIILEMQFEGEMEGYICVQFPQIFSKNLVYAMMSFVPKVIDEFEVAVLFEVLNLIGGEVCNSFAKEEGKDCKIKGIELSQRPTITPNDTIAMDTGIGIVEVDISIELHH